jgi:hypothetical protein
MRRPLFESRSLHFLSRFKIYHMYVYMYMYCIYNSAGGRVGGRGWNKVQGQPKSRVSKFILLHFLHCFLNSMAIGLPGDLLLACDERYSQH